MCVNAYTVYMCLYNWYITIYDISFMSSMICIVYDFTRMGLTGKDIY